MKWVICFDTICTGYAPVIEGAGIDNPEGTPCRYDTEAEAQAEIDSYPEFYEECFACEESEIGHKAIFYGGEK